MPPSLRSTATLEEALRAHESGELFDGPGRVAEAVEEDQEGTDLEEDEGEEPASAVDPDEAGEAGQEETVEVAPVWTEADKAEADSELQAEEVEPPRQPSKKPALSFSGVAIGVRHRHEEVPRKGGGGLGTDGAARPTFDLL